MTWRGELMKRNLKKKSLHSSVFLVILCINLCSIIVLSIFNYYIFHHINGKAYRDSFLSYSQRVTGLAFKNIDQQIMQEVLELPQLYFSSIKENEPLLLPQEKKIADNSSEILALSTEMKKIQKTCPYISSIDIYYEATDTVVTGFDKVHFPANDELRSQYIPWYGAYKEQPPEGYMWMQNYVYLSGEPVIIYISRISRHKWDGKDIVLAVSVDPDSFSEYIDQQTGKLAIADRDNQILYGGREEAELLSGMAMEKAEAPFLWKENGGEWMVFQEVSQNSGLKYYYRVDSSRFFKDYTITSRMFLFNFLISIIFNIVVLIIISYYNYAAYRKRVLTLSEEAGIDIGESHRSFDGSLVVLTKEITDLHQAVQSSKGLLFQSAVRSAVLNRQNRDCSEILEPYMTGNKSCVALFFLSEKDMEALSVEQLQEEYTPREDGMNILFTTIDKDGLAAVLVYQEENVRQVREVFVQEMNRHWRDYGLVFGKSFSAGKAGIHNSYKTAVEAARYRYILTEQVCFSYEQVEIEKRKESGSHLKLLDSIRKDMNSENLLDLKLHLEMLVTSFKSGNYTIDYCSSTLRDLVTLFYQMMQSNQLDMWVVLGYDIRDYYKKIPDIDMFHIWCDELCELILKNIHQRKKSVDVDMREQILKLVDENLEGNISLDFLADQLHIRPDAASRIFRQIMGTGYTEYIKTLKLKRAIELMEEEYSIKEIAERLGYSTPQYFIKVFKENYGITPYQYKKNREKE